MAKEELRPGVADIDCGLMLRAKGGDRKAFDELILKYQRPVFNLAYRFLGNRQEAEDAAQEVFLRLYRSAPDYKPLSKFLTYVLTIAKNVCFNIIRDRRAIRTLSLEEELILELPDPKDDPADRMEKEEMRRLVVNAVQGLPENLRMAVILSKYHELPYEEIASILGCSVTAVKLRIHRARELLVKVLRPGPNGKT